MTGLRRAALDLAEAAVAETQPRDIGQPSSDTLCAASRVNPNRPGFEHRTNKNYNAIAHRITECLTNGQYLSRADLHDAGWCVWTTTPALSDDVGILAAYLRQLNGCDRIRPFRSLASSYVAAFHAERPHLAMIAQVLAVKAAMVGRPWSTAQDRFALFDPVAVFSKLGDPTITPSIRPARALADIGLGQLPSGGGLELALHKNGLETLKNQPNADPFHRLRLTLLWATGESGKLLAPSIATSVIEALIGPFRGETPDRSVRDHYVEKITELLGDPRFDHQNWRGNGIAETIVGRWLCEQSLRMYLDIVARIHPPEFWQHRREFWEAIYRASLVDEAWVVLEAEGASAARKIYGDHCVFGRFAPSSKGPNGGELGRGMAALTLKIGTLILVDWSHAGPCLIWDTEVETGAPDVYRRVYDAARFRKLAEGPETLSNHASQGIFWHSGSETYLWQDNIVSYLSRKQDLKNLSATYRI